MLSKARKMGDIISYFMLPVSVGKLPKKGEM